MAKTTKSTAPEVPKKPTTEGLMGDGSDLHYIGVEAVYSDAGTFNIGDPRQVAARLAARAARKGRS